MSSEHEYARTTLALDVSSEKLDGIDRALGPGGIGTFVLRSVLDQQQLDFVWEEASNPDLLVWREDRKPYYNDRGMLIVQNHTTSALKLHHGDQSLVERVPRMRALAANLQDLVRSLAPHFGSLEGWTVDEMSLHRYDDVEVGLSFHRDNMRFIGLIGVLTLEGESDVAILDDDQNAHYFPVGPGDLNLTRAASLYPAVNSESKPLPLCPDHGVYNLRTPYRTSFIVRANSRPDEPVPGFVYANW